MQIATLGIILDGGGVLLAEKKKGDVGTGILSGPGGKLDPGESLVECLVRETDEEWGIRLLPEGIEKVAFVIFYAAGVPDFGVHIYRACGFEGVLGETNDARKPESFSLDSLPYDRMFDGDRHWFLRAAKGPPFCANVFYKERAKEFERIEFLPPDF
jgi:8-oxo-dGTP diphosphatase